ncbi:putative stoned B-like protein isoform X2 [Paramacrobiotus metropolitanus]|uniref:putative stoned B-like protein isoform X2 n=1 Tax=Paramacrobiotus metropolitanus TaxID=2943436 RepID=UPI002445A4D7|nr:putative stoned B-like protein isoform X2 [Paramacrobiotus metropolitanus]
MPRKRQKQLGPAPLASFDRGLSSEGNSFEEDLCNLGQTDQHTGKKSARIGVLCQTSIMEENTAAVKTRSIACQTDRSALRDGVKGPSKQRKSSQSQTSFDQEPMTELHQAAAVHFRAAPAPAPSRAEKYEKQESLQPEPDADLRAPSPTRPSTLDLTRKQKKSPTSFSKVQKMENPTTKSAAATAPPPEKGERKRSLLGKKASVVSATSGVSEKSESKSRSSSFRSPFNKKTRDDTGSASSRSVSPMLQIRQRIASLSPRRKKKSIATTKLEALLNRTEIVAAEMELGTDEFDAAGARGAGGGGALSVDANRIDRDRPGSMNRTMPSHSLSPKPSRNKKESHAFSKLQALIDRTRMAHIGDHANHEHALTTHADVHHTPGHGENNRRRSKSTPPEPENLHTAHRLSLGAVWSHHPHHHVHGHGHRDSHSNISNKSPSNPPSPFEVTKKFSIQEDEEIRETEKKRPSPPHAHHQPLPTDDNTPDIPHTTQAIVEQEHPSSPLAEIEEEKKKGETLLTVEEQDEEASSTSDLLDKMLKQKAQEELILLKKRVKDEREKRQTFRTAPVERPRSQTREIAVVDLNAYVAEAEKQPASSPTQRIKLNLHLNQDHSLDEDTTTGKPAKDRQADPENWRNFCEQGLLNKRRSRLERSKGSEAVDEHGSSWADFEIDDHASHSNQLPIPVIIETAWTPQEHRVITVVTPSPSICWDPPQQDGSAHSADESDHSRSTSFDDFSGNAFTQTANSSSTNSFAEPTPSSTPHHDDFPTVHVTEENQPTVHVEVVSPINVVSTVESAAQVMDSVNSSKESPLATEVVQPATTAPPTQTVPLRKAPPAPTRKATAPPPPKTVNQIPEASTVHEVAAVPQVPVSDEANAQVPDAGQAAAWSDYAAGYYQTEGNLNYDPSAYYYTDQGYTADNGYYTQGYYESWQPPAPDGTGADSSAAYYTDTSYYGNNTGTSYQAQVILDNTGEESAMNDYTITSNVDGVAVVLGSQADPMGHDVVMSDPSAIDIASANNRVDDSIPLQHSAQDNLATAFAVSNVQQPSQHYEPTGPSPDAITMNNQHQLEQEQSPLLEAEDAEADEEPNPDDISAPAAPLHTVPTDSTERDASFQPLVEDTAIDQTDIDYAMQTKHRRLSKVPYTSLDVEENPEDETTESTQIVPEEETVEPLLQGAADVVETEEEVKDERAGNAVAEHEVLPVQPDVSQQQHATADVAAYEQPAYDPAIYDPHGTGYDINSQEYYDYYYGAAAQQSFAGYTDEHAGLYQQTEEQPYSAHQTDYYSQYSGGSTAAEPDYSSTSNYEQTSSYNYDQTYDSAYGNTTESQPSADYYDQSWGANQAAPEPEWPTFNAYVQPETAAHTEQYADTSDEDETAAAASVQHQLTSTLPKERLFDDTEEVLPYGNMRPEPKKKETAVPGYIKVAKGKKKDLFDEMEQNYVGMPQAQAPGAPGQQQVQSAQAYSQQWQEYQKLTARVQGAVDQAKQKITPLHTPTSPPHEDKPSGYPAAQSAVPDASNNVNDLLGLYETSASVAATTDNQKKGPPSRPPPPKGKPSPARPPPPSKKTETSVTSSSPTPANLSHAQSAEPTAVSVSDELADFFGAPVPPPQPSKPVTSVPAKAAPVKPRVVPEPPKVISTDIKPIARPKAGSMKNKDVKGIEMPASITSTAVSQPQPTPPAAKSALATKTSNIDDLLGLFDAPAASDAAAESTVSEVVADPFNTGFETNTTAAPEVADPDGFGDSGYITQPSLVSESPGPLDDPFGLPDASVSKPSTVPPERQANPWEEEAAPEGAKIPVIQGWEAWDAPANTSPVPPPPPARPEERRLPPVPPRPAVPPRPSPAVSPAPTPAMSRKDMFLNSTSQDSDATFAATFGHTQDESPDEEVATVPLGQPEPGARIVSQVASMVGRSESSPLPARQAQAIPVKSASAWGEEAAEQSAAFVTDFDSDPFSASQANAQNASAGNDEANVLELIAKYKSNAPEKINLDTNNLDNSFFDPFATIVPEESPIPPPTTNAITGAEDDKFDIWDSPQRPEGLPVRKQSVNRRSSVTSNASRRTSASVQTPLFDEDDSQPLAEFTWDLPQTSWDLLLRWPPKKTLTGNRFWKQIHVKLTDTVLQLFNKADDQKPFHEVPLSGQYMITEISIQQLDVFTKIHTTKLEYVFYKERVGIRPGQIPKITKGQITKLGLPLEHASQTTELLKFGCISVRTLKNFMHAIEDALFRMPMVRERPMSYKQEEVQAHVIDEFTARVDKSGIISERKGRVRVFCLCFVSGMPTVEFGLNDIVRRGKEVVGRHDILPIYTEEWIRMESVDLHHCVSKEEYSQSKMIKFIPPDATFFELVRFRVRPPKNRELPLAVKAIITMEGYKVLIRVEAMTTSYYTRKRAQPCDDIQIRVPIPERWVYLFRTETLFGYGAKHATKKTTGLIKGMSEKLRTAAQDPHAEQNSMIEVSTGSARYEHVFRSLVWRISRLPKEGQGAYANHMLSCRLTLNAYDAMPERFEQSAEVEFTMPAATASHTTLRSISATTEEPPEKWVKYLSKYDYTVEIDYKIDRGDVQMYGANSQEL